MRRFLINFRQTARERAAVISSRAYNHYLRFKPHFDKIYTPFKRIQNIKLKMQNFNLKNFKF
ncbi:hypothetical protein HY085_02765 [Candidatus Gottesmanbacteria bacterium]|nr:hypothetical protein [Candidatus Gottesmanbacteria bacterium]